ncbi:MAG: iron ABC transporter permease [Candidatus Eremiobacteraeota bacterium]|nr:iron ABC transporter permease [Candidatus Eremiobacteraeota bacterium]
MATILAAIAGLLVGGTAVPARDVAATLLHPNTHSDVATIVLQLRLSRVVIAAIVGCALACGGFLLQGMLRNPLADPYLTGVSAGAATGIVLAITAGVAIAFVPAIGFVCGIATAALVAALSRRGGGIDANRLILAGVSLSSFFAAIITLILTKAQTVQASDSIVAWLAGTVAGRGWHDLLFTSAYIIAGLVLAAASVPAVNALRLGDTRASAIGLNVERAQWIILAATSLLAASSVVLAGTVGFVGLIGPHIARRITGSNARFALPAAALTGATIAVLADAISRSLFPPIELPIGVLLAFIGVPSFLYLYLRERHAIA